MLVKLCQDTVSTKLSMVPARFGDWVEVTTPPILGNLSCCDSFLVWCEELALVIYWQVFDVWVFDFIRARSCILAQSGKCFSELRVVIQVSFCQGSVHPCPFLSSRWFWLLCWTKHWESTAPFSLFVFSTALFASGLSGVVVLAAHPFICW